MKMDFKIIDSQKIWDGFLNEYASGSLFQTWSWGEVIKKSGGLLDRVGMHEEGKLVGIVQIELVKAKRGKFFHLRHGPIFSSWKKEYLKNLTDYLKSKAGANKIIFVRASPQIDNSDANQKLFSELGFQPAPIHAMDGEYVWLLDIAKPEEELLIGMRKTTRYLVKKAVKMGVTVNKSNNIEQFLKLYQKTASRQGFVPHKSILEEFAVFGRENKAHLYLAEYKGEPLAGALILYLSNQAIYHHGASLSQSVPASYLLQWQAILDAKRNGLKIYNFWGIAPEDKPNHPWQGLTLFKTGFGGHTKEFIHAQDLPLSPLYKLSYTLELFRKIKKGY